MPPILIDRHDKRLIYPDNSGDFGEIDELGIILDNDQNEYLLLRENVSSELNRLYVKDIKNNIVVANYVISFNLSTPTLFSPNLPQIESAYVDNEYRSLGISVAIYLRIIEVYGGVISDTQQTLGGMSLWAIGLSNSENITLYVMHCHNNTLSHKYFSDGELMFYECDRKSLITNSAHIWSRPSSIDFSVDLAFIEKLNIPEGDFGERVVLLAISSLIDSP